MVVAQDILAALQKAEGAITVDSKESQAIGRELRVRLGLPPIQGKAELAFCEQVNGVLLLLAAQKKITLTFASPDSAVIVGVSADSAEDHIRRLQEQLAVLATRLAEAQHANEMLAAELEAALQLAGEAEAAQDRLSEELRQLSQQAERATQTAAKRLAIAQHGHPRARDSRHIARLEQSVILLQQILWRTVQMWLNAARAPSRATTPAVAAKQQRLVVQAHFSEAAGNVYGLGCGCMVVARRADNCMHTPHPVYIVAPVGVRSQEQEAKLADSIAQAISRALRA